LDSKQQCKASIALYPIKASKRNNQNGIQMMNDGDYVIDKISVNKYRKLSVGLSVKLGLL